MALNYAWIISQLDCCRDAVPDSVAARRRATVIYSSEGRVNKIDFEMNFTQSARPFADGLKGRWHIKRFYQFRTNYFKCDFLPSL
jgi:hypothetical protein